MSENITVDLIDNKRSPFSLSILEIGCVVLVGVATWFGFRSSLHSTLPYPCGSSINNIPIDCSWTEEQAWETLGYPLFSIYAIPLVLFLSISAVFLLRSIRQDVRHFSVFGNLALSYPIFSFLGFFLLSVFSQICLPGGLVFAILATIIFGTSKKNKWDWVSLPYNLIWLVVFGSFIDQFLNSYGD